MDENTNETAAVKVKVMDANPYGYLRYYDALHLIGQRVASMPHHLCAFDNYHDFYYLARTNRTFWQLLSPALYPMLAADRNVDFKCRTMLHVTARKGLTKVAGILLDLGVDVNHPDEDLSTPLHAAIEVPDPTRFIHRRLMKKTLEKSGLHDPLWVKHPGEERVWKMVQLLLDRGADVNARTEDGNQALHLAAHEGYAQTVSLLLGYNAQINVKARYEDRLAIHIATAEGHLTVVKMLVEAGADIDVRDALFNTPLHLACQHDRLDIVRYLLDECYADAGVENAQFSTPLHLAVDNGNDNIVFELLRHGVPVDSQSNAGHRGTTPLHIACDRGFPQMVQMLLNAGADPNAADRERWTPLHFASSRGYEGIMATLLEEGANIRAVTDERETALHLNVNQSESKGMHILLNHPRNPINAQDAKKYTALHIAITRHSYSSVKALITSGIQLNIEPDDCTAVVLAIRMDDPNNITTLLKNGATVHSSKEFGWTALHEAAKSSPRSLIANLLEHGAAIDRVFKGTHDAIDAENGFEVECSAWTPLMEAANSGNLVAMEMFLEGGANPDTRCHQSRSTPLIRAIMKDNLAAVSMLISYGANVDIHAGALTPMRAAAGKGNVEIVRVLCKKGADVNKQSNGWAAIHQAAKTGEEEVVRELLLRGADPELRAFGGVGRTAWEITQVGDVRKALEERRWERSAAPERDGTEVAQTAVAERKQDAVVVSTIENSDEEAAAAAEGDDLPAIASRAEKLGASNFALVATLGDELDGINEKVVPPPPPETTMVVPWDVFPDFGDEDE